MPRQLAPIDGDQVRKLARLGCTYEEIGAFFAVDRTTISGRFSREYALGRADGKISLRRMQWKSAASGNVPMQIHLGKQILGQTDKHEITGQSGAPLYSSTNQQQTLLDPRVAALQCQIDELTGNTTALTQPDASPSGACDSV